MILKIEVTPELRSAFEETAAWLKQLLDHANSFREARNAAEKDCAHWIETLSDLEKKASGGDFDASTKLSGARDQLRRAKERVQAREKDCASLANGEAARAARVARDEIRAAVSTLFDLNVKEIADFLQPFCNARQEAESVAGDMPRVGEFLIQRQKLVIGITFGSITDAIAALGSLGQTIDAVLHGIEVVHLGAQHMLFPAYTSAAQR